MPHPRLAALLVFAGSLGAVVPLPVGALLQHPAHYFDLEHTRIRFAPRGPAAYDVTSAPFRGELSRGKPASVGKTSLPFPFPFAGKQWDEVYINVTGSLTFGAPEYSMDPEHPDLEGWPDGTMRWLASSFDLDAITGTHRLIVPLWGLNSAEQTHIFTRTSRGGFTVTWQAVRHYETHDGYPPLGESLFEATLSRDGSIEFRYGKVAEKDGIVGVFCGAGHAGKVLDQVELPPAPGVPAGLDLRLATLTDEGSYLHFSATFAGPVPSKAAGKLRYSFLAISEREGYGNLVEVDSAGRKSVPLGILINPEDQGFPTDAVVRTAAIPGEHSIDFYLPKIGLKNPSSLEWKVETYADVNADPVARTGDIRAVSLTGDLPFGSDFRRGAHGRTGSVYEVFHYPFVPKSRMGAMQNIYQRTPAEAEFAIVLTDFRIDDIHNAGSSNGSDLGDPKVLFHSPVLMQAAGPVYMGPQFAEKLLDHGRPFHNYAFAVGWMAHEMTHFWVATLKWKPPDVDALVAPGRFHWNPMLHTPVVTPVWNLFADTPYPEESIMGGMEAEKQPDGSVHSVIAPWGSPSGLCALDLYQMGLIGPAEVPDTFFIAGAKFDGVAGYKGGDVVPVTIADIIAANGPPPPKTDPHKYRMEIYLLHEDGTAPDPAKVAQARGMEAAVIEYFRVATNGRMTVVPAR